MHSPFSSSFTHHFFNYINVSGVNPRFWASSPTYRISPRRCCHPLALNYNQVSIKKLLEIVMHLPFSSLCTHHFFNYINVSGVNPQFWASSTTDLILLGCCCHPLAFSVKINVRIHQINIFHSLTKFSIKVSCLLKPSYT